MAQSRTKDMTQGPILPLIVKFSLPLLMGNLFQQTYNLVDTAIVGQTLGAKALAADKHPVPRHGFLHRHESGLFHPCGTALWRQGLQRHAPL